jgi:uncharacterized protein (TIGR02147 family)
MDPQQLLKATLAERLAKNPQYSIRAFARATGISHTVLSLVLSGKRRLSKQAITKLADHLGLDPNHRQALVQSRKGHLPENFETLPLDTFEVISDWYHYAILSLLELPEARLEARWIAKQLGIPVLNAKLAIERLQRLSLVEEISPGQWRQSGKPLKVDNTISTVATRKFHKQLLARAAESVDKDPIPVRDFSSMTFALDPSQVEYARQRLRDFRRQLVAELEVKGTPSAVFHFTMQLYPVTPVKAPQGEKK